jgi:S-adenosylmethionine hydrolase
LGVIVLFTDFGTGGPYCGQMKSVLAQRAPGVPVIDLFADAPRGDPFRSAYLLAAYAHSFPAGTVFLCVVDPGVGGPRKPVILNADGRIYVGPGNGLMEIVRRRARDEQWQEILWRPSVLSATFHGRDLFAPVAADLAAARQVALGHLPPDPEFAAWPDDLPEIIYIDWFGNAITGARAAEFGPGTILEVAGHRLPQMRTFSDVAPGEPFWYANAEGLVEVAVNGGRADHDLSIGIGDSVRFLQGSYNI